MVLGPLRDMIPCVRIFVRSLGSLRPPNRFLPALIPFVSATVRGRVALFNPFFQFFMRFEPRVFTVFRESDLATTIVLPCIEISLIRVAHYPATRRAVANINHQPSEK